jgi:hypothetical protein
MSNTIYYTDVNGNRYVDTSGSYFVNSIGNTGDVPPVVSNRKSYMPYIRINGNWTRVKPIIVNAINMGKIPSNALLTSEGVPFLTNTKEFFLVSSSTPGLTAQSSSDYIFYEYPKYVACIM